MELAVIDEVKRPPVRTVPRELSIVAVCIFTELTPGPQARLLETKSELTCTDGVIIKPALIVPVEIWETWREEVKTAEVLTNPPAPRDVIEPLTARLDVTRLDVCREFVINWFERTRVFV
jgi:hypothetical protein